MKQLTILLLLLSCIACKKESEPIKVIPPQPVYFTVTTQNESTKHITAELWSVDNKGTTKKSLIAKIDTIVTTKFFTQTLTQSTFPTWKCITNLKVEILNDYDIVSIGIKSNNEGIGRGTSCALDVYQIDDTYLNIYNDSDE